MVNLYERKIKNGKHIFIFSLFVFLFIFWPHPGSKYFYVGITFGSFIAVLCKITNPATGRFHHHIFYLLEGGKSKSLFMLDPLYGGLAVAVVPSNLLELTALRNGHRQLTTPVGHQIEILGLKRVDPPRSTVKKYFRPFMGLFFYNCISIGKLLLGRRGIYFSARSFFDSL
jgi:hypothetical protein